MIYIIEPNYWPIVYWRISWLHSYHVQLLGNAPVSIKQTLVSKMMATYTDNPVWYESLSGVVIRPNKFRHKHRWSG